MAASEKCRVLLNNFGLIVIFWKYLLYGVNKYCDRNQMTINNYSTYVVVGALEFRVYKK